MLSLSVKLAATLHVPLAILPDALRSLLQAYLSLVIAGYQDLFSMSHDPDRLSCQDLASKHQALQPCYAS